VIDSEITLLSSLFTASFVPDRQLVNVTLTLNQEYPHPETVDYAIKTTFLTVIDLHVLLLESSPLAFDKFRPLQSKITTDLGDETIEATPQRDAVEPLTRCLRVTDHDQRRKS
jgi:hypothetical protein